MSRIPESDLVLPALFFMSLEMDGKISTSTLIKDLEQLFQPTGLDLLILAKRKDIRFSQRVRNLKSHKTFLRYEYADHIEGGFQITPKGRQFVEAKQDILRYMFVQAGLSGFNYDGFVASCDDLLKSDTQRKVIPLTEVVREGIVSPRMTISRERSSLLRDAAREHFKSQQDGLLYCDCCNFEFGHFYHPSLQSSCIEIHHMKPLYQYEDEDITKTIEDALHNLIPICPNCHRMIHKNHIGLHDLDTFKQQTYRFRYE